MSEAQGQTAQSPAADTVELQYLLDDVIAETDNCLSAPEDQSTMRDGLTEVLREVFRQTAEKNFKPGEDRINSQLIDAAIRRLDGHIGKQLDAVLHHPEFQKLEGAWRSLKYLVDRSKADDNIEISLLNASKEDLDNDLDDQGVEKSAFFNRLYSEHMGAHGGKPYSAIIANYALGPSPLDMRLMRNLAAAGSMAHAPVIAEASPGLLGVDDLRKLPSNSDDIMALLNQDRKRFAAWQTFRKHPNSRYIALTLPRMKMRLPYGPDTKPIESFTYREAVDTDPKNYVWGSSAFAMAACMSRSFAKTRWYTEIIGETSGGHIENLPVYSYEKDGITEHVSPLEVQLNDNQEFILAEQGFIGLTMKRETDSATFFSSQSVYDPSEAAQDAESLKRRASHQLNADISCTFMVTRISHYLKLIMRRYIGKTGATPVRLEEFVNNWIRGFVRANEPSDDRSLFMYPLKAARVQVTDWEGKPGYYRFNIDLEPHRKFKGADISLNLVGQLDSKTR